MVNERFASGAVALALLPALLLAAVPAGARQPYHSPPEFAASAQGAAEGTRGGAEAELERKALALLEEVVEQAQGLRLGENRARVQATASALLWPRDEAAARAMFASAAEGVRALLLTADPADPQAYERSQALWHLRNEMLQAVVDRDPRLALEFLRSTRQPPPPRHADGPRLHDQELALETELAARIAARDPREAARLIEEGLGRGLTPQLVGALQQLAQKDSAAASRLAAAAVTRLSPEDLLAGFNAANFAAQLVAATTPPEPAPSPAHAAAGLEERKGRRPLPVGERVVIDAASRRALLETLAATALRPSSDRSGALQNVLDSLRGVLPELERYAPARAADVRRRLAEFDRMQEPRPRAWREHQHLFQPEVAPAAVLEAAEKAPPEIRDDLYRNAAWRLHAKDFERAVAAAEKISDPQQRAQLIREFERQRPLGAAERGEFGLARQFIAALTAPDQRASALVALSRAAAGRGLKREAVEALAEARAQLGHRPQNGNQLNALLEVAGAYVALDPAEAFAIVESAVGHLNELIAAAAVVDGFTVTGFREGELSPHGWQAWPEFIRRCAQTLAALAASDFDRASDAARRFERTDARVIAGLQLAQALLDESVRRRGGGVVGGNSSFVTAGRLVSGQ
ncbi:MAG TPA: hypothetical protein VEY09_16860 [Pyrinomonadaceae bacterium]|nr:hypothetical protein [Pyrinomonadaceae bacterium]